MGDAAITALENRLSDIFGFERPDIRVRAELSRSMHARPIGLATSCACGLAAGCVTAASTESSLLRLCATLMVVVAVVRVVLAFVQRDAQGRVGNLARAVAPAGALVYAALIGLTAAMALLVHAAPHVEVLMVGYALAVGSGIAVANARKPMVVLGQMALTLGPIMAASLYIGDLPLVALALILPSICVGLTFVTFTIFTTLSRQVRLANQAQQLAMQMREQARTDPVTGLANRSGFEVAARARLDNPPAVGFLALFWLDLHRFKEVNDMLGHHIGDEVLRAMADRLRQRVPAGSLLARFGSDEFLVLAAFPSRREVDMLAGQLNADLAAPMRIGGQRIECGASTGVALLGPQSPDLTSLMQHAGLALYHARVAGRSQVCLFNPAMTRNLVRRKEIEAELRAAIQKDELSIYFQPIVDLESGRIRCFEALVRWFHPEKGELVPDEFIPVAEETGLIITLGNWITRTAARAAARWPDDVTLAVNLSPVQIHAPGAALGILAALREAGLPASRLELEVTESLFLEDNEATALFMEQLAAEGVRFSLDDFGTGYSSLGYINKYPFRTIKVDRSFVSGPHVGRKSDAIIRAVAGMGQTLGMEIVAEGLETPEQVTKVRRAGCTLGQGYHFSRAVPEHLALHLLDEERGTGALARLAG